jgi:CubicO group peptidase (beta-lactamase class C family)
MPGDASTGIVNVVIARTGEGSDVVAEREAVVKAALTSFVDGGGAPGAVVVHGSAGSSPTTVAVGIVAPECGATAAGAGTIYDVASITKVLATWPLVGIAGLDLDAPAGKYLPDLDTTLDPDLPGATVSIRQLLNHTAGLMTRTRFDLYRDSERPLAELICAEPLERRPGERHKYISRSYVLLGLLLEQVLGRPFEEAAAELVWRPAGLTATAFSPVGRSPNVAPTERFLPGAPRIWGRAHDENARLLGGVAGHAGVFSTAGDLARYAAWLLDSATPLHDWLRRSVRREVDVPPPYTVTEGSAVGDDLARGLAWLVTGDGVAYHDGFTGPSLYLVPETGRYLALATNAIYGGRERPGLRRLRERLLVTLTDHQT